MQPLEVVRAINISWSMDFMSDALRSGGKIRTFNLIDDFNREALAIEVATSLPAERVTRILNQIVQLGEGNPGVFRVDNGPEFIIISIRYRIDIIPPLMLSNLFRFKLMPNVPSYIFKNFIYE